MLTSEKSIVSLNFEQNSWAALKLEQMETMKCTN